jgi:hypothetical protein
MSLKLRQSFGIVEAASVSATFADLSKFSADSPFVMALAEILKRFPEHFHLFSGPGNVKGMRAHLHAEGVLSRVRFMGNMPDTEPLLTVCDVYLACFPGGDPATDRATGAGKPSVSIGSMAGAHKIALQHHVDRVSDYIEIASRLIRESSKGNSHPQRT